MRGPGPGLASRPTDLTMPGQLPLRQDLVSRRVGDTLVVLHTPTSRIFELNPSAQILWEAVLAGSSVDGLELLLTTRFGLPPDRAVADVADFLAALRHDELLQADP